MTPTPSPSGSEPPGSNPSGGTPPGAEPQGADAELLDRVLNPLLEDFSDSFARGLLLLAHCPDRVLAPEARSQLRERLETARAELGAARALRAAAPAPMALEMATIAPWHQLVLEVWSLSAALRAAGVVLP